MSFQSFDTSAVGGGMPGWGGGGSWFGGSAGGAFLGGLAGGLVGDLVFPGRGRGGWGDGGGAEKVVQINDNGGRRWDGIGSWELFKEMSDDRREQVQQTVTLQQDLFGIQRDILERHCGQLAQYYGLQKDVLLGNTGLLAAIKDCCCNTQLGLLENRYLTEKEICGLSRQISECCCETNLNILKSNFETQIRDQTNFGIVMKELAEVKCLIKDTEKDEIIREQGKDIARMDRALNTAEILAAMKPVAPVPAYIQANPYENFRPVVRVDQDCDRWGFYNCRGFQ